ncbi:tRNA preQ1(34) S-adenosylmethionine ribosyltransferase-isomerase QueA [Desulfosoma caldarium]|uniref:S-adenosylmethionine:tRNA ribosyltransferase-isomerase n=1 Tax=Desulfosoma caldarium TaxID=610254 RepID=A0A3N1ULX4_9BACT|nr:tRNA preQ1(34) S-adenosylmethionine ribosyltransferase-isomerase QueA [Desulfosoma caldarium]ROQ92215.1 S-adenosylmethionine--tRNA ribosyltransferase-isomerase [Desulfosoma caldarium]
MSYRLEDYDYDLPEHLVAQKPSPQRDRCALMVLHRITGMIEHRRFVDLPSYFRPGDVLVMNDTRVVPARLLGVKETGGRVELLVLDPHKPPEEGRAKGYRCLVKSSKPAKEGLRLLVEGHVTAQVVQRFENGQVLVSFDHDNLLEFLEAKGRVPLPPYIRRAGTEEREEDRTDYQTVYAQEPGAVAAPTAGLHFTEELLEALKTFGVELVCITLHVGFGTFAPVRTEDIRDHGMHSEVVHVSEEAAARIQTAKQQGRRVLAVGTTVVRTLEWTACRYGAVTPVSGSCDHYIYPGYSFRVVDGMITNFHLPKTSLLILVSAFAGREKILAAYKEAIRRQYRFFSYGDAMLIV